MKQQKMHSFTGLTLRGQFGVELGGQVTCNIQCVPKIFSGTIVIDPSVGSDSVLINLTESNTFTPNSDNTNDLFFGFQLSTTTIAEDIKNSTSEYLFTVYNRWGAIVYRTNDPTIGWDGNIKGHEAAEGVYFWVIDIIPQCDPSKKYTYENTVTLFR